MRLWVGTPGDIAAPLMFYWHGTGASFNNASWGLDLALIEIVAAGGMVAAIQSPTRDGGDPYAPGTRAGLDPSGNRVWYSSDFEVADDLFACAVQQLNVDTRRVYSAGCSAGGSMSGLMAVERSGYLAGAMPNSGGMAEFYNLDGTWVRAETTLTLEDPSHVPSVITTHGGATTDTWPGTPDGFFVEVAARLNAFISSLGGIVVNCNHGGEHCAAPLEVKAAQWQFLKDHPFGVSPSPYRNNLPQSFPSYCVQVN